MEHIRRGEDAKSLWDARQIFPRDLQDYNRFANEFKMKIESKDGTTDEIITFFRWYFSYLRTIDRDIFYLYNKEERKEIDGIITGLKDFFDSNLSETIKHGDYPVQIEDKLEKLHRILSYVRFRKGLVVPMGVGVDDSLFTDPDEVERDESDDKPY